MIVDDFKMDNSIPLEQIKEIDLYFRDLTDLIPPKFYFNNNEEIIQSIEKRKKEKCKNSNLSNKSNNMRFILGEEQLKVSDVVKDFVEQKQGDNKMKKLRKKLAKRVQELRKLRTPKNQLTNLEFKESPKDNMKEGKINDKKENNCPKIFNKQGALVFSKFDFVTQVDISVRKEMEKERKKNKPSLKGLLAKTKKERKKLAKLQKNNPAAATKLKEKKMWKNILERSEGNKVRDDPKLIEKALNKKKKLQLKRKKAWEEQMKKMEIQQQLRQEKRQQNIDNLKRKRQQEEKLKQCKKIKNS